MIKKIMFTLITFVVPILTYASDNSSFRVGNNYYDTLKDAINNASSMDTIKLFSDAVLNESIPVNKTVNIDLNGNNIVNKSSSFIVDGGTLNITGKGKIVESSPFYGVIRVIGSTSETDELYSSVNIDKDVTLEGWSGIFITHNNSKSHGVIVNFAGNINAVNDTSNDPGIGIYVNGNIKHDESKPIVNILDGATIKSSGNGLYIAGNATFNINKASIDGNEAAIGMKSGELNINGANVSCVGPDTTPSEGYNNGIKSSGTAIQLESNNNYAGNMVINILNGNFVSKNSNVIYEYIGSGNSTQVKSINIVGGTFTSNNNKDIFLLSNDFKNTHNSFVSGGRFNKNVSNYLKAGYTTELKNDYYVVDKNVLGAFKESIEKKNGINKLIFILSGIFIIILGIVYRRTLLQFAKNIKLRVK